MSLSLSSMPTRHKIVSEAKRIVVKIGSSTIAPDFSLELNKIREVADDLAKVKKNGIEVILVSSGAIAAGAGRLNFLRRPETIPELQAAAAVGQIRLMHAYKSHFLEHQQITAMALLTQEDFSDRKRYIHMSETLLTLLKLSAIPIINENDSVAVEEIKVGDNDTIAAYVTNLIDADLLILLSDRAGLYDADPQRNSEAKMIEIVPLIDEKLRKLASDRSGSVVGTGGIKTKLRAAEIVTCSGKSTILANGLEKNVVSRILMGEQLGTLFLPQKRISARHRWIAYSRPPQGIMQLDRGAENALSRNGGSLLPSGIVKIEGQFDFGDTVSCFDLNGVEFARGLTNYSTDEAMKIRGLKTSEIRSVLGHHHYDEVIHRDNLVLLR